MIRFLLLSTLLVINTSTSAVTIVAQESFADYAALGLRPAGSNGTLDSAQWRVTGASSGDSQFGDVSMSGDFARGLSNGGVRTGGLYAFKLTGDRRGLGIQATGGDFTPGALLWSVRNQSGQWLSTFELAFELWWLNDGGRSTRVQTQATFDRTNWLSVTSARTPQTADRLGWQFVPQVAALEWQPGSFAASGRQTPSLAPNAQVWLRWLFDDASGHGARDEIAITSLQVRAQPLAMVQGPLPVALPAPPTLWCAALFIMMPGVARRCRRRERRRSAGGRRPLRLSAAKSRLR